MNITTISISRICLIMLYLFCFNIINAQDNILDTIPKFNQYPADSIYDKINLNIKLYDTITEDKKWYIDSYIEKHKEEFKVNFAGQYILKAIPCGNMCEVICLIKAETGDAYYPNIVAELGAEFKKNSSLLIINPEKNINKLYQDNKPNWVKTYFYLLDFKTNKLRLIHTKTYS